METKFTPGPWLIATSNSWRRIVSRGKGPVCEPVTQSDGHPDLHFCNGGAEGPDARLLAAAPDLLDALRGLVDAYCRASEFLTREEIAEDRKRFIAARAAIAKATT
ncbi:hypothetical protein ACMHYO_14140 [Allopusillimonas ginsengisoli]|uniref:hypothetical protein n=1 Tax=Allopusillimonas ginsengisoli TaxID=453575 RepID=UPI0039C0B136